jgi:2-desacetyl-2-hydroxyethyl bacteriochlorophyllide A dehydrogenase
MAETMPALVIVDLGKKAELADMPLPHADEDEVVIKTWYSGVSIGTEMWIAAGKRKDYGDPPFINGYQASGTIVEIGKNVEDFAIGDLVTVFCREAHGAYVKAKKHLVHHIAHPSLARTAALFVQPCVAANALNFAHVNTGDSLLVVGQGLVGQCTAILARLRGAYVISSEKSEERLALSKQFCADWTIDARTTAVSTEIKKRFPQGVDIVLESTGFQALLDDALASCRNGGRFVFEGFYPETVNYTFSIPHEKQLEAFYPCFIGPRESQTAVLRLMERGSIPMDALISHTPAWKDSTAIYNKLFTQERDSFNGIVIDWTQ